MGDQEANLLALPEELKDRICTHIDDASDLLALALTSKLLLPIAIAPQHLEHRWIQFELGSAKVWSAIATVPHIFEIRSVRIIPAFDLDGLLPILPSCVMDELDGTPAFELRKYDTTLQQVVANTLSCMPNLRKFVWLAPTCPEHCILDALTTNCHSLKRVEILVFHQPRNSIFNLSKSWKLTDLTQFAYTEIGYEGNESAQAEHMEELVEMLLSHCPRLGDLQLFFGPFLGEQPLRSLQRLFREAQWPRLRRLSVESPALLPHYPDFFHRHPLLETIGVQSTSTKESIFDETPFTENPKPRPPYESFVFDFAYLKSLEVNWVPQPSQIPQPTIAGLQHLTIEIKAINYHFSQAEIDDDEDISVFSETLGLRSLVVRCMDGTSRATFVSSIVKQVPQIERFALALDWETYDLPDIDREDQRTFLDMLASLPNLTHFSPAYTSIWAQMYKERDWLTTGNLDHEFDETEMTLCLLATLGPKLTFVGIKSSPRTIDEHPEGPMWVTIQRDATGRYCGYARVNGGRFARDTNPNAWGGIYHGAGEKIMHTPFLRRALSVFGAY